eukprot:1148164-Pelagomonas_calceolata.AAC.1
MTPAFPTGAPSKATKEVASRQQQARAEWEVRAGRGSAVYKSMHLGCLLSLVQARFFGSYEGGAGHTNPSIFSNTLAQALDSLPRHCLDDVAAYATLRWLGLGLLLAQISAGKQGCMPQTDKSCGKVTSLPHLLRRASWQQGSMIDLDFCGALAKIVKMISLVVQVEQVPAHSRGLGMMQSKVNGAGCNFDCHWNTSCCLHQMHDLIIASRLRHVPYWYFILYSFCDPEH